ncbi:MAG: hypothetical protein CMD68_02560 [Gammaproteobacteria bacterium]|nr:hypothetical protein [Gammaproteobacteria bacterium]
MNKNLSYQSKYFFDEYINKKSSARKGYKRSINFFYSLTNSERKFYKNLCESSISSMGITFQLDANELQDRSWPLDLIPRIISSKKWDKVQKGLIQRVKALNLFIHDVYNQQAFLDKNPVLKDLILESSNFLPECIGISPKNKVWSNICGTDLIRDHNGKFFVLEDNLRVPSGVAYMLENRNIMKRVIPELFNNYAVNPIDDYPSQLYKCLSDSSFNTGPNKTIVVLTPGVFNSAYFEHSYLAQQMGVELVEADDLYVSKNNNVLMKTISGPKKVDVIYRRIDDIFIDPKVWKKDSALGIPGIYNSWKSKKVALVNAPGSGVADDKAVYAFVPDMIRFFLKEKPILSQVKTYLCAFEKDLNYVMNNIEKLVLKPVNESGGYGILIGPQSTKSQLKAYKSKILRNPRNFVAQPLIKLSTAPTIIGSKISPRHLDLRPFILSSKNSFVTKGGLTRVAMKKGSTIVNSSQGGGSKDTWIAD